MGAFVALTCSIWAVALLPLTTAVTLGFAQVFFIALLAVVVLNETLGPHRTTAIMLGFVGVVWVMQPSVSGVSNLKMLVPLIGALGASVAVVAVRKLSHTESTQTLLVYQAVFVGVLAGIPLLWLWKTPDRSGLIMLLVMGVLATAGQWLGVKALRLGEASVVGSVKYTELVFAAVLGFFLFEEVPGVNTMMGAAIIVAAALYMLHREAQVKNSR